MNNIFTRSLMILFALLFILIAAFTMITAFNFQSLINLFIFLRSLSSSSYLTIAVIVSLIFLLSALIFLSIGMKKSKDKKYVSRPTNMGEVQISFITIQNIAMNAASSFSELKNISVSILNDSGNIKVIIRSHIMPGVNIPALSEQVQEKVKISVEESTGVAVSSVKVYIQGIYQEDLPKNSIEARHLSR